MPVPLSCRLKPTSAPAQPALANRLKRSFAQPARTTALAIQLTCDCMVSLLGNHGSGWFATRPAPVRAPSSRPSSAWPPPDRPVVAQEAAGHRGRRALLGAAAQHGGAQRFEVVGVEGPVVGRPRDADLGAEAEAGPFGRRG